MRPKRRLRHLALKDACHGGQRYDGHDEQSMRSSSSSLAADGFRPGDLGAGIDPALFGGAGALWGPVIGAMTLVPAVELLHAHLGELLPGIRASCSASRSIMRSLRPADFIGGREAGSASSADALPAGYDSDAE